MVLNIDRTRLLTELPESNPNLLVVSMVKRVVSELSRIIVSEKEKMVIDECGGRCRLKLENDQLEDVEKVAIRELGRYLRAIAAVEMTLKLMAEDKGCVELENFVVIGKSKIKVLSIYRTRLLKEFLESKQNEGSVSVKEKMVIVDECGGPLFVRAMVVVCLLERVPFTAIDSSMSLRKLENDPLEDTKKVATSELGGVLGALVAVEMALTSAVEDNGCVELENFVVSGKSRIMVLNLDGTRLLKELPESKKNEGSVSGGNRGNN
ncbi:hypothetical protein T459_23010 [Capsicum annuum]|uniref:Uncharacterized protein n=1 Tax=Capsicum annuum TaxID=4072 RepID=A0A2G2YRC5_CAPAN|nr:hypothetical protein T459_23010 [Capsicum annuum]